MRHMSDEPQPTPADPEEQPSPPPASMAEVEPPEDWLDWQENLRRGWGRRLAVDAFLIIAYLVMTGLVVMGVVWWWKRR